MKREAIPLNLRNISLIAIPVLLIILLVFWILISFLTKAGKDAQFSIRQGQGVKEIATDLSEKKLIKSPVVFSLYVYYKNIMLQSGVYSVKKEMNLSQIISLFSEGKVEEYLVTIPEGWRASQIDQALADKKIIKQGDLLKVASADEGYLFPDTYRFALNVTSLEIRTIMLENFKKKTEDLKVNSAQSAMAQVLSIASIVEREAKFDEDRPKIAGVYYNRLDKGMKLEADPTIQYAKGSWVPITRADYHDFESPYNTYLHEGLPPTPICNPGLKSIEAALYPQKDGYLYFFHKADGHAIFSKTYEEHETNIKKYQ